MPKAPTTKRKVTPKKKDAPSELEEQQLVRQITEGESNSFWNCTGPITINNHYKETITIPHNTQAHWTADRNNTEQWLHLWHLDQKITKLQLEFYRTANWDNIKKINFLQEAKTTLLETGTILDPRDIDELAKIYYDGEGNIVKNYNNNYYVYTYFRYYEPGEIIIEDITNKSQKTKLPKYTVHSDELY